MNWKRILVLAVGLLAILLALWSGWGVVRPLLWPVLTNRRALDHTTQGLNKTTQDLNGVTQALRNIKLTTQNGKSVILRVEVVTDAVSITRGLSGRAQLGSDGMLFVFSAPGKYQFWMKEMLFSIDMIWIYQQQVIGITESVPFPSPGVRERQLPRYNPPDLVDMVLEVPAGYCLAQGIKVGSRLVVSSD